MLVKKAFKFRIYPNQKQIELINKTIGCSRFVFNYFLAKQKQKDAYWYIAEEMKQNGQLPTIGRVSFSINMIQLRLLGS